MMKTKAAEVAKGSDVKLSYDVYVWPDETTQTLGIGYADKKPVAFFKDNGKMYAALVKTGTVVNTTEGLFRMTISSWDVVKQLRAGDTMWFHVPELDSPKNGKEKTYDDKSR
jgi:hypothetical protein